jgi:tRNA dimethylallyltransferase
VDRVVLAVFGPTASGKTAVVEALARRLPADVISADSMQVYRGLPILTNQPQTPTRLVGIWPLDHDASVGEYAPLAHAAIDEALAAERVPIVSGGTGLYLRAALAELALPPPPVAGARVRLERLYDELGPAGVHGLLEKHDPNAARAVHPNDRRRVVRALELAEAGRSLRPSTDRLWGTETRHRSLVFTLDVSRDVLAARVGLRTREMFERGVEAEVRAAMAGPISRTALQVIGLREVAELPPREARESIVRRTLRFAAYQRKWLRRIPDAVSLAGDRDSEEIADQILEVARARQRLLADRAG